MSNANNDQKSVHTVLTQREGALAFAANGSLSHAQPVAQVCQAKTDPFQQILQSAIASSKRIEQVPRSNTCEQCYTLSFFFDGTGNNEEADTPTLQQSNVAKLYQAHLIRDEVIGRYAFYIPGIGTYFKEIKDFGHNPRGLGFGYMGKERLDWALARLQDILIKAKARHQPE